MLAMMRCSLLKSLSETCAIQIRRGAKKRGPKPLYAPLIGDEGAIKCIIQGSLFVADVAFLRIGN